LINKLSIIYDLDGTIIDTQKVHDAGWMYAARSFDVAISEDFLLTQRGIPDEIAALYLLPSDKKKYRIEFAHVKEEYVLSHFEGALFLDGFEESISESLERKLAIAICTGSSRNFVQAVKNKMPLLEVFSDRIICKEDYRRGKPSGEPLIVTLQKLNLSSVEAIYVGDAKNDYLCAKNAGVDFVHFGKKDIRTGIPDDVLNIEDHRSIFSFI